MYDIMSVIANTHTHTHYTTNEYNYNLTIIKIVEKLKLYRNNVKVFLTNDFFLFTCIPTYNCCSIGKQSISFAIFHIHIIRVRPNECRYAVK